MRKKINCKKKRKKYEFSIFKFYDISKKLKIIKVFFYKKFLLPKTFFIIKIKNYKYRK